MESNSFDHLELKFALLPKGTASVPGAHLLKFSVLINGINISPENVIDLSELIASLKSSGSFNIVTCVCGEAGCIGESQGISVNMGYQQSFGTSQIRLSIIHLCQQTLILAYLKLSSLSFIVPKQLIQLKRRYWMQRLCWIKMNR